ncbi:iron uptake system protein EfeO [Staphylococcus intermedius]|uniref:Efem/EfeO family lipoprotein n=1 Tax=Staphylococcus intermedius NCTC 11048 TaxID=1141106 RepID=A0A380GBJ3_STAIN|nr:iron uptake system protein EfeO [Staphylococcus intermedius]PCF65593.1 EfeM/EfeO family lipoprotein [Staphylococcus intermedius]PCF81272.1 EfeM/EfeO family lipoprotein [Staphylococcus intermedius]PCF82555.1 EfeM/EfeO family lipoprotein [Staphylococcus intermedius]PCF87254.1 EfeM/EfeO family lipoprotein [Staphylococcus intermedius]PCF87815.1 EfeM/EfeO family lipoprotein [Staphylococcus intermedius]
MKKLTTVFIASSLLFAACGNQENSDKSKDQSSKENTENKVALEKATKEYKSFTDKELDQFLAGTEDFVQAVKNDDMEKAKSLYPNVRMYYERSEPVAESFGDLDPKIDARLADLKEENKESEWTGYHKIEKALYEDQMINETTKKDADQLLKDAKELRAKADTLEITPKLMLQGSVDLLNEISTSKITGEEEIYSHTDLYDFKANIEGAQKIYELFKPILDQKDKDLSQKINSKFDKVNGLLDKYKKDDGYILFTELTDSQKKELSNAVNELGEPLSQMAVVTE